MHTRNSFGNVLVLATAVFFCACAATETLVTAPTINLVSVEIGKFDFQKQTFLLEFDVENSNSFPLPIKKIRYTVRLEDRKFARGEARCDLIIPAHGEGDFVISVDLDLLNAGTELASIVRSGVRENIVYELDGSLTVDIPLTRPIGFSSTGTVAVQSTRF
jgi:LEA14-like dessication related protein